MWPSHARRERGASGRTTFIRAMFRASSRCRARRRRPTPDDACRARAPPGSHVGHPVIQVGRRGRPPGQPDVRAGSSADREPADERPRRPSQEGARDFGVAGTEAVGAGANGAGADADHGLSGGPIDRRDAVSPRSAPESARASANRPRERQPSTADRDAHDPVSGGTVSSRGSPSTSGRATVTLVARAEERRRDPVRPRSRTRPSTAARGPRAAARSSGRSGRAAPGPPPARRHRPAECRADRLRPRRAAWRSRLAAPRAAPRAHSTWPAPDASAPRSACSRSSPTTIIRPPESLDRLDPLRPVPQDQARDAEPRRLALDPARIGQTAAAWSWSARLVR
jgi:hypothetical protein